MHRATYVYVCIFCLHCIAIAFVFASCLQCNHITSTWCLFLHCTCTVIIFASQIFLLSSCLFLHHFVFLCFDMFLKSMFSCFINYFIWIVQVFVFFCFGFACFKFSWFFLFDVLCRCNLFRFYITFIVSMSFFFSFFSFVVYFILFIMSTTMKKVCCGGSTNLVLEVLNNILPVASIPPTPPKQLLKLILMDLLLLDCPHQ